MSPRRTVLLPVLLLPFLILGCSSTTDAPAPAPGDGQTEFDGRLDPQAGHFLLERVETTGPEGEPVWVDLVGRDLEVDPGNAQVSLEVALRNQGSRVLYPPASVLLRGFRPGDVVPLNADATLDPGETGLRPEPELSWLYDYSGVLGPDGGLAPGALSGFRRWIFLDPGLGAFSFGATAHFGLDPDAPHLAGRVFLDEDRDGRFDPEEPAGLGGVIHVDTPAGLSLLVDLGDSGLYRVPAPDPGLYRVEWVPPPTFGFAPVCLTTPNPLEVILPLGPDGGVVSFDQADFGIDPLPCFLDPVVSTDRDPADIEQDPYWLSRLEVAGEVLHVTAGFGGCQPEHPFTLFVSREFSGADPPRTWALLAHDDLGEECEAAWERSLAFDLGGALRSLLGGAGDTLGPVHVDFLDFEGQIHELIWEP